MGGSDEPHNGREPEESGQDGEGENITGGYGGPGPENEVVSSEDEPQDDDGARDDDGEPEEAPD